MLVPIILFFFNFGAKSCEVSVIDATWGNRQAKWRKLFMVSQCKRGKWRDANTTLRRLSCMCSTCIKLTREQQVSKILKQMIHLTNNPWEYPVISLSSTSVHLFKVSSKTAESGRYKWVKKLFYFVKLNKNSQIFYIQ